MGKPKLEGFAVLILEDDFYVALDLRDALSACGAVLHGPFGDVGEALRGVERQRPDCALIDINLGAGPSFDLADRLASLAVPFAFVTGYDQAIIPPRHQGASCVRKPLEPAHAPQIVAKLLGLPS